MLLQLINYARMTITKNCSKRKRYQYCLVYRGDNIKTNQGFELYGIIDSKSINTKVLKGNEFLTSRTKSPAPVKIKFTDNENFISITKKELSKVCDALENREGYEFVFKAFMAVSGEEVPKGLISDEYANKIRDAISINS